MLNVNQAEHSMNTQRSFGCSPDVNKQSFFLFELLYIIADNGGALFIYLFSFRFMANHLQLSISGVGCRVLLVKEHNGDSLHHIANGAVFQASPVMRKGKEVIV